MQYDFDQIIDRQSSDSEKWNHFEPEVLPMWVADMDFYSPEPVIQALMERIDHRVFGYPESHTRNTRLMSQLHETIVERMAQVYSWNIEPNDILFLPGVVTGFNLACHALVGPDERVFIQTPVYFPILHAARNTGCLGQEMELTLESNGSYTVNWDIFEDRLTSETRLFLLCNPHNPIGKVFREAELLRMAESCLRRDIIICSDEIHSDLVFSGHQHRPIASLDPEIAHNTITLMAPSKTYNLAGLHCSFAIIQNPELRRRYMHSTKGLVSGVNLMGLHAALAAYREGGSWLSQLMVYLEANRDYLLKTIREKLPEIRVAEPQATYLAWLDCRGTNIGASPGEFFQKAGQVGFNEGASFGKGGEGFIRLNFGCPRQLLSEGLHRMQKALEKLSAS